MFDHVNFASVLKHYRCKSLLDIGANTGEWATAQKLVSPEIHIMCVEGNPECDPFLKKTGFDYMIQMLSDDKRPVSFYLNPSNSVCTGSSYYKENSRHYDGSHITIQSNRLDAIFNNDRFDSIKIDTQGSELDILTGGVELLKNIKVVCIEVSKKPYNIGSPLEDTTSEFMESNGFVRHGETGSSYVEGILFQVDEIWVKNDIV
jgi:FkbM family methyltransferase